MNAEKSVAQRLGRVLETVTRQSGRLSDDTRVRLVAAGQGQREPAAPAGAHSGHPDGLHPAHEPDRHRGGGAVGRRRFPVPSVFDRCPGVAHLRCRAGLHRGGAGVGTFWVTRRIMQSSTVGHRGARADPRPTSATRSSPRGGWPGWCSSSGASAPPLLTTLYGLHDTDFIPRFLFAVSFSGVVVATACYLFTEFALRPVAAQALEAGPPPRRLTGDHGPHDARVAARLRRTGAGHCCDSALRPHAGEPHRDATRLSPY